MSVSAERSALVALSKITNAGRASSEYDERADSIGSYYAAVEAKRLRGDTHWPSSDQQFGLNSSSLESITSLDRLNPSIQCIDKSLSSPLAGRAVDLPLVRHEDFSGLLNGRDVSDDPLVQDFDGRLEPKASDH